MESLDALERMLASYLPPTRGAAVSWFCRRCLEISQMAVDPQDDGTDHQPDEYVLKSGVRIVSHQVMHGESAKEHQGDRREGVANRSGHHSVGCG